MTTPDWLAARGGAVVKGLSERTWIVTIDDEPQYRLDILPAKGQFTCAIVQTNNSRRLDGGKIYPTPDAALAGGHEELRTFLGW
ncbi:MAG TPA: hypothetical protein VKD71_06750 [Gemmataceae bacterium]|nr:hypothetical protein [Gemmataceae bacterium]